jgi:hypothetical protein
MKGEIPPKGEPLFRFRVSPPGSAKGPGWTTPLVAKFSFFSLWFETNASCLSEFTLGEAQSREEGSPPRRSDGTHISTEHSDRLDATTSSKSAGHRAGWRGAKSAFPQRGSNSSKAPRSILRAPINDLRERADPLHEEYSCFETKISRLLGFIFHSFSTCHFRRARSRCRRRRRRGRRRDRTSRHSPRSPGRP